MILDRGFVWLVGAGPGDPGLLTRAGADALAEAEVVVHDYLVHNRLVELAPASATRIFAGKRKGRAALPQARINELLVEYARRGLRVVRLKGGDPFVFGRGGEEAEYLHEHGIPFRIVPGVTAGVGVPAYAGVPITHRRESSAVALITGHEEPDGPNSRIRWDDLARFPGTLVLYMSSTRLDKIAEALIRNGKAPSTPAITIQWGTLPKQRSVVAPLAELAGRVRESGLRAPTLTVIGDVVDHRRSLNWYERLPLFGRRIVVTRPREELERSAAMLEALGAEVLAAPLVDILPIDDVGPMDEALARLNHYDWVVFTSANGVRHVLERMDRIGLDLRVFGGVKLAAIGPATAAVLRSARLRPDLIPEDHRSEGLVERLAPLVVGRRVLLARADRGRTLLLDELSQIAEVDQVAVYRNVDASTLPDEVLHALQTENVDWITLTSSAITERLHNLLPDAIRDRLTDRIRIASISPVTSETARKLGWSIAAEADPYTWEGLIAALVAAESGHRAERT